MSTRRVALKVAYRGKYFAGSQRQPGKRTVEGEIIANLETIEKTGGDHNLKAASRTDAGVSALCNVFVVDAAFSDDATMLRALNAVSRRIYYISAVGVPDNFDPRKAESRSYKYVLPVGDLDLDLARECATLFIGEHDFSMFCKTDDRDTVIEIKNIDIDVKDGMMSIYFNARNYLWHLVRRLVAAIVSVASGKHPISHISDALAGKRITFGLADPSGLVMTGIEYKGLEFPEYAPTYLERLEADIASLDSEKSFLISLR